MPKISLWQKNKNLDYQFFDRNIREMFHIGGTDFYIHKYLGPGTNSTSNDPSQPNYNSNGALNIQDLLFLENRDRKYDPDIFELRGSYTITDIDFNLTQFGIMLSNDAIVITFHINETIERLGRKILSGDVLEVPHLKDDWSLDLTQSESLRKFYVVDDVAPASEGYSPTWWPHLYRVKAKPITDSQEYKDILQQPTGGLNPNGTDTTLADLIGTHNTNTNINNAIIAKAEADAPLSGYQTQQFFVIPTTTDGVVSTNASFLLSGSIGNIIKVDSTENITRGMLVKSAGMLPMTLEVDEIIDGQTIKLNDVVTNYPLNNSFIRFVTSTLGWSSDVLTAKTNGWTAGYLTGDGIPPNGYVATHGTSFSDSPTEGEFFLRTDYYPNRLFRFDGATWRAIESNVKMTMTNNNIRNTQKSGFINNQKTNTFDGQVVNERQSLSQVLKPKADF